MVYNEINRITIAGLKGSSGKTVLSLGLAREWKRRGLAVAAFKKGPDYIDARWLTLAAGAECRALDTYLGSESNVYRSFVENSRDADISVIEGNRGIFDGMDYKGTYSTAEVAKLIKSPVVLVIDCAKTTRTAAVAVMGCRAMDPQLDMAGIVVNNVANDRHSETLKSCIEAETGLPVLGSIPRLRDFPFPERHLGLVMPLEHEAAEEAVEAAAGLVRDYVDIDALFKIAGRAHPLDIPSVDEKEINKVLAGVKVGVVKDAAFSFYYPENMDQLRKEGATIVEIDAIADNCLPEVDALYIGGGFPETLADKLAGNESFRNSVKNAALNGLPVYAECGGAMYLGESILYKGSTYPMAGALPITYEVCAKPQGHGYTELEVELENPFYGVGKKLRGHEFHYSRVLTWKREDINLVMNNLRGRGFDGSFDGVCKNNVLALYSHVNDLYGGAGWARALVNAAVRHSECTEGGKVSNVGCIRAGKDGASICDTESFGAGIDG